MHVTHNLVGGGVAHDRVPRRDGVPEVRAVAVQNRDP